MHIHAWEWIEDRKHWRCSSCGETITLNEYRHEYGAYGNFDIDPIAALNRLAAVRWKRVKA